MRENVPLLHNMSAPPKSVVKYAGLADMTTAASPIGRAGAGVFGTPIRFALPSEASRTGAAFILDMLGVKAGRDPDRRLRTLIDQRAQELPLPDGCAVVPTTEAHQVVWPDLLSALAVLTKCSDAIWLRTKAPSVQAGLGRRAVSLLVPPSFATRLPGPTP